MTTELSSLEIPFQIFNNFSETSSTMAALSTTSFSKFKTNYHVKRFLSEIEKEFECYKSMQQDIMDAQKWEGEGEDKVLTNKEEIDEKIKAMSEVKFSLKWAPLPLDVLTDLNPSPSQIGVLEHFYEEGTIDKYAEELH